MIPNVNSNRQAETGISLSQVFRYRDTPVEFEYIGERLYANVTPICQAHGRKTNDYLRLSNTEEFIKAVESRYGISRHDLVLIKQGGNKQGTWIHEKLIIDLSRWLSPAFAVQCDEWVADLLRTGKVELVPREYSRKELALMILEAEHEKEILLLENAELKPKAEYADKVLTSVDDITTTTIAKELGMSAKFLNQLLVRHKIQYHHDGQFVLYAGHKHKGLTSSRTHVYTDNQGKVRTRHYLVWTEKGREFIHRLFKLSQADSLAHSPSPL